MMMRAKDSELRALPASDELETDQGHRLIVSAPREGSSAGLSSFCAPQMDRAYSYPNAEGKKSRWYL